EAHRPDDRENRPGPGPRQFHERRGGRRVRPHRPRAGTARRHAAEAEGITVIFQEIEVRIAAGETWAAIPEKLPAAALHPPWGACYINFAPGDIYEIQRPPRN